MEIVTYNLKLSASKYFIRNKKIKYAIKFKDKYNDKVSNTSLPNKVNIIEDTYHVPLFNSNFLF